MENTLGMRNLYVRACGTENCTPGHSYGPAVRSHYLIHYIFAGRGVYQVGGRQYQLHAGQGFIIYPGVTTTYRADENDPWQYGWLGYSGLEAAALTKWTGLTEQNPTFTAGDPDEIRPLIESISRDIATLEQGEMSAVGGLLCFLARIARSPAGSEADTTSADSYFRKANWFIEGNLEHPISVSDVASFVGLCRSQLFRVFRQTVNCGPQEWIQRARLRRAERLLSSTRLSLEEVALSSGYTGVAQLGQAFRRAHNLSPSAYRRQIPSTSSCCE